MIDRRTLLAGAASAVTLAGGASTMAIKGQGNMYGLIGSMTATPGNRDALAGYLLDGLINMPGNLSYIVAHDPVDADKLWITEVWDSTASHLASLKLPQVQAAITKARPVIAAMGDRQETVPVGGVGLAKS
jgi:quinol monooxygenase YgiN